jgi:hypothetical protein
MAAPSIDHSARVIALPTAAAMLVENRRHRGRYPEMVVPAYRLAAARYFRRHPAEIAATLPRDPILDMLAELGPAQEKIWRARIALAAAENALADAE